jgi:hypothetical protein
MKSIGLLFVSLCTALCMAPSLFAQSLIQASIHVSVVADSAQASKTLDPARGEALVVKVVSTSGSQSGFQTMSLVCPGCSVIPQGCPCDTLKNFNLSGVTRLLANAEVQDSSYRATNGRKGKHRLLAYYIDPGTFSGRVKDYRNIKKATRFVIDRDHTSYDIKIRIPSLTLAGSMGGRH